MGPDQTADAPAIPSSRDASLPGSRGQLVFTRDNCVYCTVCAKKCPTGALVVNRAQKRWAIDRLLCITCGYCVEVCPKKSLALHADHNGPTVTKDLEVC